MTKDTVKSKDNQSPFSVFGVKPEGSIYLPTMPITARNNCQIGKWVVGDNEYNGEISLSIVKFSKWHGDLGKTCNEIWGQVWFVPESGELFNEFKNSVLVTYIKSISLRNLNFLISGSKIQDSKGNPVEPATGIFSVKFKKQTGQKPDERGISQTISYYYLEWDWRPRQPQEMDGLSKIAAFVQENKGRMLDIEGTKQMTNVDNLPPSEYNRLLLAMTGQQLPELLPAQEVKGLPESEPF